jgi:glycosyltransferase involved in cell wall biosynthesis
MSNFMNSYSSHAPLYRDGPRLQVLMIPSVVDGPNSAGAVHFRSICTALARIADVAAVAQDEHEISSGCKVLLSSVPKSLQRYRVLAWLCQLINMSFLELRAILKIKPNCVYARFGANSLVCAVLCSFLRIPIVVEFNGLLNLEASDSRFLQPFGHIRHFPYLIAGVALFLERFVAKSSSGLVCVSPTIQNELVRRHDLTAKTRVIENGVDCQAFAPASRVEARKKLALDLSLFVMVYVGSLVTWQGLDILPEAARLVISERTKSVFVLVGDGPLREQLLDKIDSLGLRGNFIFVREVSHREIPTFITAADICLAPFKKARNQIAGPSPLKILEYMACGRAVVTTRIPGVSELVTASNAGIVVPPDDPREFAGAILHLLGDPTLHEICEGNARLAALALDWDSKAKELLHFLHLVVSTRDEN